MEYSTPGKMNYKIETEAAYYTNNEVLDIEQTKNIIQKKHKDSRSTTCFYTIAKEKIPPKRYLSFSLRPLVFLSGVRDKEPTCQCRRCKRRGFDPWVGKMPWRRRWQPTPVFSSGESHGQRSLVGYSPWGLQESDMT